MRKIDRPNCPNPLGLQTNYKHPENKSALVAASSGKCMYCESKISHTQFGDIEHIKPKSKYPEGKFDWNNLGLVCSKCNNAKGNKYNEHTPYVNPYEDDPEDFFVVRDCLIAEKRGDERAELTISDIKLNRDGLLERRKERLDSIQKFVSSAFSKNNESLRELAVRELKKEASETEEYSLFVKTLLELHGV